MSSSSIGKLIDFTEEKLKRMVNESHPETLQHQSMLMALEMYQSALVDIHWVGGEPMVMIRELDMLDEIEEIEYGL